MDKKALPQKLSHEYYIKLTPDAIILGLVAGFLAALISMLYVHLNLTSLYMLVAVLGVFLAALIMLTGMERGHMVQVRYAILVAVGGGITTALGSYFGHSGTLTSITLVIIIPFVALTSSSTPMIATSVLYLVDMFIIGSGLPAHFQMAAANGGSFAIGGLFTIAAFFLVSKILKTKEQSRDHIHFKTEIMFSNWKNNIRFAILLTLAVLIANIISYSFHLLQGYWIPMTAMLILKSDYEFSKKRIKHRFLGTFLGSFAAYFIISYGESRMLIAAMMLPVFFFMIIALAKHYGAYTFFLTIMITMFFNLISPLEHHIVTEHRLEDTLLGIFSVVIVLWLIHPMVNKFLQIAPKLGVIKINTPSV